MTEQTTETGVIVLSGGPTDIKALYAEREDGTNQIEATIKEFERRAREEAKDLDMSVKEDRDKLRTLAASIASSKVAMTEAGKELTEEWRAQTKAVNEDRNLVETRLSALKTEVRDPLTKWEEAEKLAKSAREEIMERLTLSHVGAHMDPDEIQTWIDWLDTVEIDDTWGKLEDDAEVYLEQCKLEWPKTKALAEARVADEQELERRRVEDEQRGRLDELRARPVPKSSDHSSAIVLARDVWEKTTIDEAVYGAFYDQAVEVRADALQRIADALEIAEAREAKEAAEDAERAAKERFAQQKDNLSKLGETLDFSPDNFSAHFERQKGKLETYEITEEVWGDFTEAAREKVENLKERNQALLVAAQQREQAKEAEERAAREAARAEQAAALAAANEERARQEEREKIEADQRAEREAAQKRAADEEHRKRVCLAIAKAASAVMEDDSEASFLLLAEAILDGKIPHVEAKL